MTTRLLLVLVTLALAPDAWGQSVLTWGDASNNEQGFHVERANSSTGTFARLGSVGANVQTFTDPGGVIGQCYKVQAYDTQAVSAFSNIACRVPPPLPPDTLVSATCSQVTVPDPPPTTGQVASYAFSQGSGSVATSSTSTNHGTISGAAWTPSGKYGSALSFDGVNDWVTIPDANALDLTTSITLAAWVFPTATSGVRDIVIKEGPGVDIYNLYARNGAGRPEMNVFVGGSNRVAQGPTALPANVWSHVAGTYGDGFLRLYVNGVQVASMTLIGPIATSTGVLRIGGNGLWGEYFQGRIDEVRIYNRALSQAEIQSALGAPLQ